MAGPWQATAIVNYLGGSQNIYAPERVPVASWTTLDTQLSYNAAPQTVLSGLHASLSVRNLFDRDPPYVQFDTYRQGLNYDSLNVTPLGRVVTLQLSKDW